MIQLNKKELKKILFELKEDLKSWTLGSAKKEIDQIKEKAWELSKATYSKLPKNAKRNKITPFSEETKVENSFRANSISSKFKASEHPFSMIHAIVGSRKPRNQKGIAVSQRKPLYTKLNGITLKVKPHIAIIAPKKTLQYGVTQLCYYDGTKLRKLNYGSLFYVLTQEEKQKKLLEELK